MYSHTRSYRVAGWGRLGRWVAGRVVDAAGLPGASWWPAASASYCRPVACLSQRAWLAIATVAPSAGRRPTAANDTLADNSSVYSSLHSVCPAAPYLQQQWNSALEYHRPGSQPTMGWFTTLASKHHVSAQRLQGNPDGWNIQPWANDCAAQWPYYY